jgi:triphosphoribosyl-dephospho-CoA synthase
VARSESLRSRWRRDCARLDRICTLALGREARAWPKPGLVSARDAGSHGDMDVDTMLSAADALRGCFAELALAGALGAGFDGLSALGLEAERRMTRATAGVNTHRGAIFHLGLLVAASARRHADPALQRMHCGHVVARRWGPAIRTARAGDDSHGNAVFRRHAAGGARDEAAAGFPSVYRLGLPLLRCLSRQGHAPETAQVGVLMAIMEQLDDTNLLWRGGAGGLAFARLSAARFNRGGGVSRRGWRASLVDLHQAFVTRHLSPGGAADLVAATWACGEIERYRFDA